MCSSDLGDVDLFRFTAPAGTTSGELRDLVTAAKGRLKASGVVIVGAAIDEGKVAVVVTADSAAKARGAKAGAVLNAVLAPLAGRGGGNDDMAQGAGTDVAAIDRAMESAAAALAL